MREDNLKRKGNGSRWAVATFSSGLIVLSCDHAKDKLFVLTTSNGQDSHGPEIFTALPLK